MINNGTISNNTLTNSTNIQNNFNHTKSIDTWKIIVITICCILFTIISIIIIRLTYIKRIIIKRNKNLNDIKEVYQKPEYIKSNEFINYEKPNCY